MKYQLETVLRTLAFAFAMLCLISGSAFAQEGEGDEKKESAGETTTEKADTQEEKTTEEPKEGEAKESETQEGEGDSTEATQEPDNSFEGLIAQFQKLDKSMVEVRAQFDASTEDIDLRNYRDQYVSLVNEANIVMEKIREAGMEKLKAGDTNQTVYETMIGVMMNESSFKRLDIAFDIGEQLINSDIDPKYFDKALESPRLNPSSKEIVRELAFRSKEAKANDLPRVKLTTSKGEIVLELFENEAPQTVGNFISLVEDGYYDGLTFHRVIEGFMAQGGCPKGDGTGDPGYKIFCECYKPDYRRHFVGSLSMAKSTARNTGGSQFFITFDQTSFLDGKHTVFGRVIEGMDVVNVITRINPEAPAPGVTPDKILKAEVVRKRDHEYEPTKVGG